jgi:uncharacterized protein (TIRG00374 family)
MQSKNSRRKLWLIIAGIGLLVILFVFLIDVDALLNLLGDITWSYVAIATIILLIGYLLLAVRLRYILFNRTGWWETFYANSIAFMLHIALFVPALAARVASTGSITSASLSQASSAILIERLMEQIMRLLATILAILLFTSKQTYPSVSIGLGVFLLVAVFGAIFWIVNHPEQAINSLASRLGGLRGLNEEQIRGTASSVIQGLEAISSARRLGITFSMSFGTWACFLAFQFLVLAALPLDMPTQQMWLIAVVVLAVMPPSINVMLIVYQLVVTILLTTLRLTDTTTALTYAITLHLLQMIVWLILGIWAQTQTGQSLKQLAQSIRRRVA